MNSRFTIKATLITALLISTTACFSPQQSRFERTETPVNVATAPSGTPRVKIALINFRNLTGRGFLVEPATAVLTSLMVQSRYFEVIEPSLVESVIRGQGDVTPEKLQELSDRFGAQYFLMGTLTNFEIRETQSGFCLLFGLLGSSQTSEYIVETAIDYRLVTVPDARIIAANAIENRRVDTSESASFLFNYSGQSTRVAQSSGGKLLRYALADLTNDMIDNLAAAR